MPEVLRFPCHVVRVEERFIDKHISGHGDNAIVEKKSIGWFLILDNYLALPCGEGRPDFEPGNAVRITVEKAHYI